MPVFRLTEEYIFPRPNLAEENGLLAIGGDLSPGRLISGYRSGIFPWFSEGDPLLWWFTSPRLVIFPRKFRISKRLARYMRKPVYRITMDHAFRDVIGLCASIRQRNREDTWITPEMIEAYTTLHSMGFAHSVECWQGDKLAGGLYGIALDRVFFGESMFSAKANGSKIALAFLALYLKRNNYQLIDCQMTTNHLLQFGACEISGREFSKYLSQYIKTVSPDGNWKYDSIREL